MKRLSLLPLFLFNLWFGITSQAAPYFSFRKLRVEEGLSHNSAKCALQDSYGFLWIGTSGGLNRFDGNNNIIYRTVVNDTTSLTNNYVFCLAEDANHDIWVGTNFGLYLYRRTKDNFERFDKRTQYGVFIACEVKKILMTSEGRVWIGTLGQGFFIYDPQRGELQQNSQHVSFVWDICETTTGEIYIASQQEGLHCFDKEGQLLATYSITGEQNDNNRINCMYQQKGQLWMGVGDQALCSLDLQSKQLRTYPIEKENCSKIRQLLTYNENTLMAGTDNGLYLFECQTHTFSRIDMPNDPRGLSDVTINGLLRDTEGGVWILTETGGVNYMPRPMKLFNYYQPKCNENLSTDIHAIGPFCEDNNGTVWIGTRHGLYRKEKGDDNISELLIEGQRYDIRALWCDGDILWIGTDGNGLKRLDLKKHSVHSYTYHENKPHSICGNNVRSIYRTTGGEFYVGTTYGLCRYLPDTDNFLTVTNIGYMVTVVDMHEDRNGILWLATAGNGVFRCQLDNKHWKQYMYQRDEPASLTSNYISVLFEDRQGVMWFGTNDGGLCSFDAATETFTDFDPDANLLSGHTIHAIEEDREGYFWISGDDGLTRIHPYTRQHYYHFVEDDGLQSNQFTPRSSLLSASGDLYFGGINGFNIFRSEGFNSNNYAPSVYITGIHLQHADEQVAHQILHSNGPFYLQKQLVLPYSYNSFSLNFTVLSYQKPHQNSYSYILHGVDKEWITGTDIHQAVYTHLPPGKYRFELRGANNDGCWSQQSVRLEIVITPPWWRTDVAHLCYALLAISLLAYIAWRWNAHMQRKYYHRMEEFRSHQEKEMYKSKISFFVNLVHEIRTPLSLISLPLEILIDKHRADVSEGKYFSTIRQNVNYLLGITNELLDFQKMENESLSLKPTLVEMTHLLKDTVEQFTGVAEARGLILNLSLPEQEVNIMADCEKISKVLVNLLSNALKFTHSRIDIGLHVSTEQLEISVTDDGDGLSDVDKQRAFEPFYQAENAQKISLGTGLGLAFARSLAQAHEGELTLHDAQGGGCRAVLVLPVKTDNSKKNEPVQTCNTISLVEPTIDKGQQNSVPVSSEKQNCTILLVEDNNELLNLTADSLRQWYKVIKATNGIEALEWLEREGIDVIVSDVMMPEINGLELCRRVKENINYSHIPVLLLTAKTTIEAKVEGMESGADAYLEKPFAIKQLHRQIENILRLRMAFHRTMMKIAGRKPLVSDTEKMEEETVIQSVSQKDYQFIERVNTIVKEALADEQFSIDKVAESLGMSRSNFYRKVKALTGVSPNDYLRTLRLNRAAELLKNGMRISDVYAEVGFSSSSYFAKCFKAQFGVLPKEYV